MCVRESTHAVSHMWRSEGNCGSQVVRLCGKCLYHWANLSTLNNGFLSHVGKGTKSQWGGSFEPLASLSRCWGLSVWVWHSTVLCAAGPQTLLQGGNAAFLALTWGSAALQCGICVALSPSPTIGGEVAAGCSSPL